MLKMQLYVIRLDAMSWWFSNTKSIETGKFPLGGSIYPGDESPAAKLEKSELYAHCWCSFFDSVTIVLKPCAASEVWIHVFLSVCLFGIWVFLLFVLFLIKHVSATDCHWQDGAFSLTSASFFFFLSMTSSPHWLRRSSSDLECY